MEKHAWKSPYVTRAAGLGRLSHHRVGAVSYFNARPLLEGLDHVPEFDVTGAVPSELRELLASGEVEAALLPVIDIQRFDGDLVVLPAGCISSAGTTLTVRIFSQVHPSQIHTLWVDSDSHTSVALAQVLWHFMFKRRLRVIPFTPGEWAAAEDAQAVLCIGDKVVNNPPIGFDFQFDLGRLWFEMTGLPFTFAIWAARPWADCEELYRILSAARRDGQDNLYEIARKYAPQYNWPEDLAVRYLTKHLQFEFTDAHREGLEEFFALAEEAGVIEEARAVQIHGA